MNSKIVLFLKHVYRNLKYYSTVFFEPENLRLFLNPKEIPFVIINFNQLYYLKKLIDFAKKRGFKKIVIIDNVSTYPPLLDYYKSIESTVTIERMNKNYGHMVFFDNAEIYEKYGKSFFILTDADIEPNENLPENFMRTLLHWLIDRELRMTKVGFALEINDIPSYYSEKQKVLKWEKQFWENKIEKDVYIASIDTTFAIYRPNPKKNFIRDSDFFRAIRIAGNFTCRHGGWYINSEDLSEEQNFYINNASSSSSWIDTMKTKKEYRFFTDPK